METLVRAAMLAGVAVLAIWMRCFVTSVESAWQEAHELRLTLLASPSSAYAAYCQVWPRGAKPDHLCKVSMFRKTHDHGWIDLCSRAFTKASRWYEIQLECKAPLRHLSPITAKTRIWR